jgi:hypothetical protein
LIVSFNLQFSCSCRLAGREGAENVLSGMCLDYLLSWWMLLTCVVGWLVAAAYQIHSHSIIAKGPTQPTTCGGRHQENKEFQHIPDDKHICCILYAKQSTIRKLQFGA